MKCFLNIEMQKSYVSPGHTAPGAGDTCQVLDRAGNLKKPEHNKTYGKYKTYDQFVLQIADFQNPHLRHLFPYYNKKLKKCN